MNGIVIVDKPAGMTSHDVVGRLRRIYNTRRVGHSGTLDPMATGVLPVFVGRATRACEFALCDDKRYLAQLRLGIITDTQDITGAVLETHAVSVTSEAVASAAASFLGEILQTPPMYSAIKVGGVPLYKLARKGETLAREPRKITIRELSVAPISATDYELTVTCSKGAYIRTLCEDIGRTLGCGATLTALRRLRSGKFDIAAARTIGEIEKAPEAALMPTDSLFSECESAIIGGDGIKKCKNGAAVPFDAEAGRLYRVYGDDGEFLMLARGETVGGESALVTVKSFFEV